MPGQYNAWSNPAWLIKKYEMFCIKLKSSCSQMFFKRAVLKNFTNVRFFFFFFFFLIFQKLRTPFLIEHLQRLLLTYDILLDFSHCKFSKKTENIRVKI